MVSDIPAPSGSPSVAVSGGCRSSCPRTSEQKGVTAGECSTGRHSYFILSCGAFKYDTICILGTW